MCIRDRNQGSAGMQRCDGEGLRYRFAGVRLVREKYENGALQLSLIHISRSLHGMLELDGVPEELKEYVEDYSLHILDVCHTPDERLREFPPEICFLLMCIKYAGDKERCV